MLPTPTRRSLPVESREGTNTNGVGTDVCVLVLDAHRMVSAALRTALRGAGLDAHEIPVGGTDSILAAAAVHPEAVVLLEPVLQLDAGRQRVRASDLIVRLTAQGKRAVVLSDHLDETVAGSATAAAVAAGAVGVVDKSAPFGSLVQILAAVAAGRPVMTAAARDGWLIRHHQHRQRSDRRAALLRRLTPREREVLHLMATGHRAGAIATHFVVAVPTVRTQIRSILIKLEVTSQLAAVALLFESGHDGHAQPNPHF